MALQLITIIMCNHSMEALAEANLEVIKEAPFIITTLRITIMVAAIAMTILSIQTMVTISSRMQIPPLSFSMTLRMIL